jgi:hypothetical protein
MAKRFGRNQKKKLQADLEKARSGLILAAQVNESNVRSYRQLESEMSRWAGDILAVCGQNSQFNRYLSEVTADSEVLRFAPPLKPISLSYRADSLPQSAAYSVMEAFVLMINVEEDPVNHSIGVKLKNGDGSGPWFYAVDRYTFKTMPPRLIEEMGHKIARLFAEKIRRDG